MIAPEKRLACWKCLNALAAWHSEARTGARSSLARAVHYIPSAPWCLDEDQPMSEGVLRASKAERCDKWKPVRRFAFVLLAATALSRHAMADVSLPPVDRR